MSIDRDDITINLHQPLKRHLAKSAHPTWNACTTGTFSFCNFACHYNYSYTALELFLSWKRKPALLLQLSLAFLLFSLCSVGTPPPPPCANQRFSLFKNSAHVHVHVCLPKHATGIRLIIRMSVLCSTQYRLTISPLPFKMDVEVRASSSMEPQHIYSTEDLATQSADVELLRVFYSREKWRKCCEKHTHTHTRTQARTHSFVASK